MTKTAHSPAQPRKFAWLGTVFSLRCALIILLGLVCAGGALLGGIMLFATRLSMAPERALVISGVLALLLALGFGALAAVKARRLGFWETMAVGGVFTILSLVALGRTLAVGFESGFLPPALTDIAYLANLLGNTMGGPMGGVALASLGLWLFSFIGSSLGFLLGGSGRLDLHFGYEAFIARNHLRLRRRSATMLMTVISICGVAVGVLALTVVLSVMGGFETDLKSKIVGANAHAVVLKYGTNFSEWRETADKVRQVRGVVGATPFILNEVMLSSDQNLSGTLLKGIDPASAGQVSDLQKNLIEGQLDFLVNPADIPERQRTHFIDVPVQPLSANAGSQAILKASQPERAVVDRASRSSAQDAPLTVEDILRPSQRAKRDPASVLPGIILGKELAAGLKVRVGDRLNVVSPLGGEVGPTGPMPKSRPFRVAGIFHSGMYEFDAKSAYIDLTESQRFFGLGESVTGLELKTTDIDNTRQITRSVLHALDGYPYRTKDFAEMNKNLFSALRLERLVMAVILGFIVLVACFNIVSTLIMMVLEKGKDIAILKSMGASDTGIMKIFVLEGLLIGGVGTVAGTVLGYATCLFVEKFGIRLDSDVYYIDRLPVVIDLWQFLGVACLALLLSYLATIYPATRASRLPPVDGLRNE
ncbi:MAG: ABC transporter permease [Myxococcales bacterium]|nr:ABC transporter permease [Myxococcales bacterium]